VHAVLKDFCCGMGGVSREQAKKSMLKREQLQAKDRSAIGNCCAIPFGRTADFIDMVPTPSPLPTPFQHIFANSHPYCFQLLKCAAIM
jgi:hypothetical protein